MGAMMTFYYAIIIYQHEPCPTTGMCLNPYPHRSAYFKNPAAMDAGFTLVEVLIAMLILSVGLLGVTGMSRTTVSANRFSKNMTSAVTLAQTKMEDLQRIALTGTLTNANDSTEANLNESGVTGNGIFTRTTDVTGGAGQLTTLKVTITWTEARARAISLTTLLRQ